MDIEEINKRLEDIRSLATRGDCEGVHGNIDSLYREVLIAISKGVSNSSDLAKEALKSEEVDCDLWYA